MPTITLQSGLDLIDQPVIIDGTTQPITARVELNGNGLTATGLVISGGNSIVRGMVINRFGFDAISLEGNGGNVVEGNFIGTDPTGTLARPNGQGGIRVFSSGNRIGGLTAAARNVISGNTVYRHRAPELDRNRQRGAGQLHRPQRGGHGGAAERRRRGRHPDLQRRQRQHDWRGRGGGRERRLRQHRQRRSA